MTVAGADFSAPSTINLAHLSRLMGVHGLYEHALLRVPRPEHGYCTDDNARAVVVTAGRSRGTDVFDRCLSFVIRGWTSRGWRNRMSETGAWEDDLGAEDAHGRALWALGAALRHGRLAPDLTQLFEAAARRRLRAPRAVAYAVLGACLALGQPDAAGAASDLLGRSRHWMPPLRRGRWMWPEDRLTYANARLPQAMMMLGHVTGDTAIRDAGVELLRWLVSVEWHHDRFSFAPVGGRSAGETGPAFDQQPIEAWAMAESCEIAALVTGDTEWESWAMAAVGWFHGRNDGDVALYDPVTGAGHDGLTADGVNLNCGAESTLSALGALAVGERISAIITL